MCKNKCATDGGCSIYASLVGEALCAHVSMQPLLPQGIALEKRAPAQNILMYLQIVRRRFDILVNGLIPGWLREAGMRRSGGRKEY
jgi:hypothetical protein